MSAIKEYADVHVDKMNLKEDINRDKVKECLMLAITLDTAERRMEDLEFSESDLLHFKGFIFLQRYDDKVTVSFCIVNVLMKPNKDDHPLRYEEIMVIKETYLYYKYLESLKKHKMIDAIHMIDDLSLDFGTHVIIRIKHHRLVLNFIDTRFPAVNNINYFCR